MTTLWMRYVKFERVKNILHIVSEQDNLLTVSALEREIRQREIFADEGKSTVGHSTLYHYRKVMENLGLLRLSDRRYHVSDQTMVRAFLSSTAIDTSLSENEQAKELLRKIIVTNADCQDNYFDMFMDHSGYSFEQFKEFGKPVGVRILTDKKVINGKRSGIVRSARTNLFANKPEDVFDLEKLETEKKKTEKVNQVEFLPCHREAVTLESYVKVNGIFWGIRLWANDLGITDELISPTDSNLRIIYPVKNFEPKIMKKCLLDYIDQSRDGEEWVYIYIPQLIEDLAKKYGWSVAAITSFLRSFIDRNRALAFAVPTSSRFTDFQTPFMSRRQVMRQQYLIYNNTLFSHIALNKGLKRIE